MPPDLTNRFLRRPVDLRRAVSFPAEHPFQGCAFLCTLRLALTNNERRIGMSELLTKKELASLFKISTRTIDRWRATRLDLGAIKIGNVVRFHREKVEMLLKKHSR
jgi:excisionase family DNA binding protein